MMFDHIELKPCPFCGGKAEIDGYVVEGGWFVQCADEFGDCHQPITNNKRSPEAAAAMWNRREGYHEQG